MADADLFSVAFQKICATEAPLSERLALLTAAVEAHAKPFANAYQDVITQISAAAAGATAPGVGDELPTFLLPDHTGELASLESCLGDGSLVVSFNRGHWCEYCELELRAFAEAHAKFAA